MGRALYGRKGELLLDKDVVLTNSFIQRIRKLQFAGLYIKDDLSEGIEIHDVIPDVLRNKMSKEIRSLMANVVLKRSVNFHENMTAMLQLLESLVNEIMSSDAIVFNIIDIKQFDLYTYQHSVNVCVLSCIIGKAYEMTRKQLYKLALGAIMHDIGKVFIDKDLLNKLGKLSPEEFEIIKTHSMLGYNFIRQKCKLPHIIGVSILQHHERFNGCGYPYGKKSDEIILNAQIIAIADVFDAMTSERPYHGPLMPSEAYEFISGSAGHSFSWELVNIFTRNIAPFPLGLHVQLSNGREGIVYQNYEDCLMRPLVKLKPEPGQFEESFIDLKNDADAYNVTIQKVLT